MMNRHYYKKEMEKLAWQTVGLLAGMAVLYFVFGSLFFESGWVIFGILFGVVWLSGLFVSPRYQLLAKTPHKELKYKEAPDLFDTVATLSEKASLSERPKIFLVHSSLMNAFALNDRGVSEIYVSDGLLSGLNEREVTGVLAHEISHLMHRDITLLRYANAAFATTNMLTTFFHVFLFLALPLVFLGRVEIPLSTLLLVVFAPHILRLMTLALMRNREFAADMKASWLTSDPMGLALALEKIDRMNVGIMGLLFPASFRRQETLYDTHPAPEARIKRLINLSKYHVET